MATNITFENLSAALKRGEAAPITVVHGPEGYFADRIADMYRGLIDEADREFDMDIIFATRSTPDAIIDACRRFPMMGARRVVIVKEAQGARVDQLNKLAAYAQNPSATTALLVVFRGADAKGGDFMSAVKKSAVANIFQSKPVRDYNMGPYITSFLNGLGLNVQPKAREMLVEYVGADLSRMYNEVGKLAEILGKGATVTPEAVERNIGVSRDYNTFELSEALAVKDAVRVRKILDYMRANPKAIPLVMATSVIFNFFANLLIVFGTADRSERSLMQALGLKSAFQLKTYNNALRHYNSSQTIEIISAIRRFDAQSKGGGSRRPAIDLFEELLFRILTAPGNIFAKF